MIKIRKMFKDLKKQDTVNILYKDNNIKKDIIEDITSHDGFVSFTLHKTKFNIKCKSNQAIYHYKDKDVLIFIR